MSEDPYLLLDAKLKRIQALNSISGLIGWDELVNLPEDSADQRQEQCAAMAQVCHAASVDPEIDTLLSELETRDDELDGGPENRYSRRPKIIQPKHQATRRVRQPQSSSRQ